MLKKKIASITSMLLIIGLFSMTVFAATSTADVKNGSTKYGTVYINAKSSSIYAETSASSSGSVSTDAVQISANNCETVKNVGASYTTAWTSASGSFSGNKTAAGTIQRGSVVATGATSATI